MKNTRLKRQIEFIVEIDKLKNVYRQTFLINGSRKENDAEHSWHLAMMAILLSEYAEEKKIDILRIVKMVLIHDLVEIDAGDTYCYDVEKNKSKKEREKKAANRLFRLLPRDQGKEYLRLWGEFERNETPEACFAAALDRLQPLIHNYLTEGKSWIEHGVTSGQVIARNKHIKKGAPILWDYAEQIIRDSVNKGYLVK
ncbi:MAG TPA: HD domain-containing protein [Thermoplasmata archaeon]|nr:HD domain-containing protein [Thermoplasmata archaeon]